MEIVSKLPDQKPVIGAKEVAKGLKAGKIKRVIVARNCPDFLMEQLKGASIEMFDGDQSQLATKLGKPFPIAVVGYA